MDIAFKNRHRIGFAVAATVFAVLLAGCRDQQTAAGAGAAQESVASVATAKASPSTAKPSIDDQRPAFRPDQSPQEMERISQRWYVCLRNQGVPMLGGHLGKMAKNAAALPAAYQACQAKEPRDFQEVMAKDDPAAWQGFVRRTVKCLREKGLNASQDQSSSGYKIIDSDHTPVARSMDIQSECQRKSWADIH